MITQNEEEAALVTTIDTILGPSPPSSLLFGAPAVSARQVENATHRKPGTVSDTVLLKAASSVAEDRGQLAVLKTLQRAGKSEAWVIFRPGPVRPTPMDKTLQLLAPPPPSDSMPAEQAVSPAKSEKGAFWNKLLHRKADQGEKPPEKIKIHLPPPHAMAGQQIGNMDMPMITQSVDSVEGIPRLDIPIEPPGSSKGLSPRGDRAATSPSTSGDRPPSSRPQVLAAPSASRTPQRSPTPSPRLPLSARGPTLKPPPARPARASSPRPARVRSGPSPGLVISLSDCETDASEDSPFGLESVSPSPAPAQVHRRVKTEQSPAPNGQQGRAELAIQNVTRQAASRAPTEIKVSPVPPHPRADVPTVSGVSTTPEAFVRVTHQSAETERRSHRERVSGGTANLAASSMSGSKHRIDSVGHQIIRGTQDAANKGRRRAKDDADSNRPASRTKESSGQARDKHDPRGEGRDEDRQHRSKRDERIKESRSKEHRASARNSKERKGRSKTDTPRDSRRHREKKSVAPPPTPWADVAFQDMPFRIHFPVEKAPTLLYRVAIQLAVVAATLYCLQRTL